jgi:hypothetical protein
MYHWGESDAQLVLIIPAEQHAEMVLNLPSTLKLEVLLVHQDVGDGLGVLRTDGKSSTYIAMYS